MWNDLFRPNHPDTLLAMGNLARTYSDQGRIIDAAKLEEQVLEKRKQILGENDPNILLIMRNLVRTYSDQRRIIELSKSEE